MSALPRPSLHLITSRVRLRPGARTVMQALTALEALIDDAIEAGVDVVQVRERDVDAGLLLGVVTRAVARSAATSTRILVNERADVAQAAGAAGVHLPSSGMAADRLRTIEHGWILGRSIHPGDTPADRGSCDYLLFGTVFASGSKGEGSPVAGLDGLAAASRSMGRPVVAIGGITPDRTRACLEAGASGVAAIGAFLPPGLASDALGVREAVRRFRSAMKGREAAAVSSSGLPQRS